MASQKKIFILEDDESLVNALKECFERAGFYVASSQHPGESLELLKQTTFDFLIVDCLLPQTTGVAFLQKANSEKVIRPETRIILTSGIYTDRDFIQESIHQTKAIGFIKKPINLNEILEIIKKNTKEESVAKVSERNKLYQIFSKDKVSVREKRKLIEALEEVFGFDLPFIYSLLVETKSSGYLNIYGTDGSVSGITISEGAITAVDIEDEMTYLGSMLIQSGYILPDDLQLALNDKSNTRKIGEKLIESNMMSPHALDIVLREQMNIRLSRTIQDEKVKINFVSTPTDLTIPYIDADRLTDYLHSWVASKLTLPWLKAHYLPLLDHYLLLSPNYKMDHPIFDVQLSQNLPAFVDIVSKRKTIREMTQIESYNEATLYKAIHFLLTKGALIIGEKAELSENTRLVHLLKIQEKLKNSQFNEIFKTYFAQATDFNDGMTGLVGEEPVPNQVELFQAWKTTKEQLTLAYSPEKSDKVKKSDQAKSDFEIKIQATKLIDDAKNALYLMKFREALSILNKAAELSPDVARIHMMYAWVKIGLIDPAKKAVQMQEIEMEMLQIPPDEKYDATFVFVTGLFAKVKGDIAFAKKSFEKAVAMDPNMIMARRELNLLKTSAASAQGKQDIFSRDLKDVVSGFFKKK